MLYKERSIEFRDCQSKVIKEQLSADDLLDEICFESELLLDLLNQVHLVLSANNFRSTVLYRMFLLGYFCR